MNGWQMTQMADSPAPVDERAVDHFFQLVPPTPRYAQHLTHPIPMQSQMAPGLVQPLFHSHSPGLSDNGHLATDSHHGLRSHRSSLSVGSIDSFSAFSGQWSNISSTDSVADSDDVAHGHGNGHKRQVSLSIDPNLFRPKDKSHQPQAHVQASGTGEGVPTGGEDEGDLPTAVPKKTKKPSKKKGTGMTAEERKKVSHARKQQPDHIPRPRNAFILFRKHVVDSKLIPPSVEMRHQNVSIITAKMWSEAPPAQKAHFNELARYPGYRYQPVYRRTNVIRRRVRKDEAEEEKCRSVAELLMKGKSGDALEQEIKEKIKPGEHFAPLKKVKAPDEKTTSASELSKGAIRALRAQARHDSVGSGDWSDVGSRAASPEEEGEYLQQDHQQDHQFSEGVGLEGQYGYTEGMGYVHPALGGWNFEQRDNVPLEGSGEWQNHGPGYAYPQPHGEYQPYDNLAVPTFSPPQPQQLLPSPPQHHISPPGTHSQSSDNKVSTDVFMPPPFPSPTSVLYPSGMPHGRLSARWDTTHFALPPSHDVSFGNMGNIGNMGMGSMGMTMDDMGIDFNQYASGIGMVEGDMMLHDFGAALAQAEEMTDGEWK